MIPRICLVGFDGQPTLIVPSGSVLLAAMTEPSQSAKASPPELVHTVRRGTRVVLLAQIASQVVSLVVLALMLRLVPPADYGLLGMILPAVMLPRMAATLGL